MYLVLDIEKIIVSKKRPHTENVAPIRSFLETAICYLFSECNDDDCIYGSLYKLAGAFSSGFERNFDLSTSSR